MVAICRARTSDDFAARVLDDSGELKIHDHQFPSANTAIPALLGMPESVNQAHRDFLEGSLRLDIVGLKEEGRVDGELHAPLRPHVPTLQPGRSYLLETVLRTLTLGHAFTQGTADSNQVWVDVEVYSGDRLIGRSGAMEPAEGRVDPWSHFVNAWVIDRDGRRIDRRNAEDIFTALYDNQIPPGAADVVHYRLRVPEWVTDPVVVKARLNYRKFDTTFMRYFQGEDFRRNDLPVTLIASDQLIFPVAGGAGVAAQPAPDIPVWQRINDYGIGLLRKRGTGELRQAEEAFRLVEGMGQSLGALNLARVYLREGRLDDARDALERAIAFDPPAYPWTVTWFTALLDRQNGYLDQAIDGLSAVAETRFVDARARGLDFSKDYRVLNTLADTLFQRARAERGAADNRRREQLLTQSEDLYRSVLQLDPENAEAYWGLAQIYAQTGRDQEAAEQRRLHAVYKRDDNARDRAIALARRSNPAANHAAEAVVIYDLQRPGAYGSVPGQPRGSRDIERHTLSVIIEPGQARIRRRPAPQSGPTGDDAVIGVALRRSLFAIGIVAVVVVAVVLWRGQTREPEPVTEQALARPTAAAPVPQPPAIPFTDITAAAGIRFRHDNGAAGERLLPETMGGGVAFFALDEDALPDLLFVNSTAWPWSDSDGGAATPALYRNLGDGRFEEITAGSGVDQPLYGMGVATGDYDGDGRTDLFLTAVGHNRLLRNVDGARFERRNRNSRGRRRRGQLEHQCRVLRLRSGRRSGSVRGQLRAMVTRAGFRSGLSPGRDRPCLRAADEFPRQRRLSVPQRGRRTVYRSRRQHGCTRAQPRHRAPVGKGLAVLVDDIDRDGWSDLVVANDTVRNFFFRNLGGHFEEQGVAAGLAFDNTGSATGAMGIDGACMARMASTVWRSVISPTR